MFAALVRVMLRCGRAELTLRAIAAEAGVTAGALVQRFGSIEVRLDGSFLAWTLYREGSAAERLRDDLEATLRPYLVRGVKRKRLRR